MPGPPWGTARPCGAASPRMVPMATPIPALVATLLHASGGPPGGRFFTHWYLEPSVAVTVVGLVAAYVAWTGPLNRRRPGAEARPVSSGQRAMFLGGCLALLVALGPPLDDWSGYYLLSAHMVQHLILTMLVPPLLLLGTPPWVLAPLLRRPVTARLGFLLTRPVVGFALAGVAYAVWHLPPLYVAALREEPVHILEHQVFLLTGLLAWWPLCGSLPAWPRLSAPLQCLYLALTTIPGGIVGAVITLADPGLYPPYGDVQERPFGLGVATDQQIAGLIMWVGANTIYLLLISVVFLRWASREESADRAAPRAVPAPTRPAAGA